MAAVETAVRFMRRALSGEKVSEDYETVSVKGFRLGVKVETLQPPHGGYEPLLVFMIGFLGGFFERLVPDLLNQTNLGTREATPEGAGTAAAGSARRGTAR